MRNKQGEIQEIIAEVLSTGKTYTSQKDLAEAITELGRQRGLSISQATLSRMKNKNFQKKNDKYVLVENEPKETNLHVLSRKFATYTNSKKVTFFHNVKIATLTTRNKYDRLMGEQIEKVFGDLIIRTQYPDENFIVIYYREENCKNFEEFMHRLTDWCKTKKREEKYPPFLSEYNFNVKQEP